MKKIVLQGLLLVIGYSVFAQMTIDINEVKSSNQYFNKTVLINGKVTEVDKISSSACKYMLQDTEGDKIMISSSKGCPALNKEYTVKGRTARDNVSFMLYFKEEERIPVKAPAPPPEDIEVINVVDDEEINDDIELDIIEEDEDLESDFMPFEEEETDNEELFYIVENMPKFRGGDQNEFRKYIQENLQYPDSAVAKGIQGKVFVQFVVNSKGDVVNAKIVRSADIYLDAEALRVVNSSPKWEPGLQRGKPVNVVFTFPIVFLLQ